MLDKQYNIMYMLSLLFLLIFLPELSYADEFKPSHYCSKPSKPFSLETQFEVDIYNSNVRNYKICIEEFIDKQKEEIDEHRKAMKDAIEEWNNFVKYNR